jgi:hypothetical protein
MTALSFSPGPPFGAVGVHAEPRVQSSDSPDQLNSYVSADAVAAKAITAAQASASDNVALVVATNRTYRLIAADIGPSARRN